MLDKEVERVKKQANGYPGKGNINARVWLDGVALANYGKTLADFLSKKDFLNEQVNATGLWAKATLSVCSHYHHMVGPAMVAYGAVNESAGNIETAKKTYSAVLQDFECILNYVEEDENMPEGDRLIALQSLQSAATKLLNLEEDSEMHKHASKITSRIHNVLLKE